MPAIPSITRKNVEAALSRIAREGVPPKREATRYLLRVGNKRFPPKYVLSLAAADATGRALRFDQFSGGDETNRVLASLGYRIEPRSSSNALVTASREAPTAAPSIARIVVRGRPPSSPAAAAELLQEAFGRAWPTRDTVKYAITPGGFISDNFPDQWSGGVGWKSTSADLSALAHAASPALRATLTSKVLTAARKRTTFLTLGIDLFGDAAHAELVAVVNCKSGKVVGWTGKSYPTGRQASRLVHVADLASHLFELDGEPVLVLGCHDLNMFSARSRANQAPNGPRRDRWDAMAKVTARFRPTVVLQHPHSTDTPNIWRTPWACLKRDYPSVRVFASAIAYHSLSGKPRRPLRDVLDGTRSHDGVLDVVVRSR